MITVYVLLSQTSGKYYVGITKDLNRRLMEHNLGKSTFTSVHRPWRVIYTEIASNYSEARKREKYLKTNAGKKFVQKQLDKRNHDGSLPA